MYTYLFTRNCLGTRYEALARELKNSELLEEPVQSVWGEQKLETYLRSQCGHKYSLDGLELCPSLQEDTVFWEGG